MNILFDQGTPVPLRRYLAEHTVTIAYEQGWSALANGQLLTTAEEAGYDLFITTDQNLRHQQQVTGLHLAILVLRSTKSREEARHYLHHPVLGERLLASAAILLEIEGRSAGDIFGSPDDLKLKSAMTLFEAVSEPDSMFARVLDMY